MTLNDPNSLPRSLRFYTLRIGPGNATLGYRDHTTLAEAESDARVVGDKALAEGCEDRTFAVVTGPLQRYFFEDGAVGVEDRALSMEAVGQLQCDFEVANREAAQRNREVRLLVERIISEAGGDSTFAPSHSQAAQYLSDELDRRRDRLAELEAEVRALRAGNGR
jgi:hypothetical protein